MLNIGANAIAPRRDVLCSKPPLGRGYDGIETLPQHGRGWAMSGATPEVFADQASLADAAAEAIAGLLRSALSARGHASLVATGGRSPGPVYDRLSHTDLDWAHVAITLSDERHDRTC